MTYYEFNSDMLPHISFMNLYSSPEPYRHPRRIPGEYIIFFMKSGNLFLSENGIDYHLKEGDMIILDPDGVHEGTLPAVSEFYYIHLKPTVFKPFELPADISLTEFLENNRHLTNNISPFSQEMYDHSRLILPKTLHVADAAVRNKFELAMNQAIFASEHRKEHYKLTCSYCFMQILIDFAACFSAQVLAGANLNFSKSQQRVLEALTDYLHFHYNKKLTSVDLENEFKMNFDYLNRMFKKKTGTPIFAYLNTLRINKAIELLASGQTTKIYEIARAVGYSDEYYFSKVFKKQTGMSPKNFLKLYQ